MDRERIFEIADAEYTGGLPCAVTTDDGLVMCPTMDDLVECLIEGSLLDLEEIEEEGLARDAVTMWLALNAHPSMTAAYNADPQALWPFTADTPKTMFEAPYAIPIDPKGTPDRRFQLFGTMSEMLPVLDERLALVETRMTWSEFMPWVGLRLAMDI